MTDADDKESVDRAFAELVAGFHLTSDRPDHGVGRPGHRPYAGPGVGVRDPDAAAADAADQRPARPGTRATSPDPGPVTGYEPGPPPPLPRPAWPVLVGWIGLGYAVLTVLAIAIGIELPRWAGWAGIIGFVGGFALLVSRLPRQRPPDAGDGAVL